MTIHFEITPYWVEFWCHFFGMGFAMMSGAAMSGASATTEGFAIFIPMIISIILISIGAHQ